MKVTIVDRATINADWGQPGPFRVYLKTVEIDDRCPVCGSPRGIPKKKSFFECGCRYWTDCWSNPCGHIDKYENVLKEATN